MQPMTHGLLTPRFGFLLRTLLAMAQLSLGLACDGASAPPAPQPTLATELPDARPALCAREADDAVRDLFCATHPPAIRSLRELQAQLGLAPRSLDPLDPTPVATPALVDFVVFQTHSTALSGRLVSPINPRAIIIGSATLMTFQRGVQQVELATQARDRGGLNFYLVSFSQACNDQPGGCGAGDLFTPQVESDWTRVTLRDDEDLKNTALDCRQCHRRGRADSVLLMRELESPWTHFFEPEYVSEDERGLLPGVRGRDLLLDYLRAKGDEPYAGVSSLDLRHTVGMFLQNVVEAQQPVLFDAPRIERERWELTPAGQMRSSPVDSATWDAAYEAFKRGEQLPLPYVEPRVADAAKLVRLSDAYARFRRGELAADALPDLSDIFPDDPRLRARIGLQTEPDAAPASLLIQACASCHNDVLDQTISRARFSVDLGSMSDAAREKAIERISLPIDSEGVMPPPEARQLDEQGRQRLIAYLRRGGDPADAAALSHAARMGMAGGGRP